MDETFGSFEVVGRLLEVPAVERVGTRAGGGARVGSIFFGLGAGKPRVRQDGAETKEQTEGAPSQGPDERGSDHDGAKVT